MAKGIVKEVKDPWFERQFLPIGIPLSKAIAKTRITANHLTWTSFVCALVTAGTLVLITLGEISHEWIILAGLCALAFWILDTLDGKVARLQKKASPFGGWMDVTFGITSIYLVVAAMAFYTQNIYLAILFPLTYYLKVFYCGTFQEYYKEPDDKAGISYTPSYAPDPLSRTVAEMNMTNTVCLVVFAGSIVSFWWAPVFTWAAILYVILNIVQSIAMVAIQYGKMKKFAK